MTNSSKFTKKGRGRSKTASLIPNLCKWRKNTLAKNEINDQVLVRRQKLEELKEMGIEPFGRKYDREALARDLDEKYLGLDKDELNANMPKTKIAGRMLAKRGKGKVGFADLYDRSGKIQIYVRKDMVGEENYQIFKKADLGDFLGVEGEVFKTDSGELSVRAQHVTFLSKALRPLPDKYHGLKDVESIYRQRYLDLITNHESYQRFVKRTKIIQAIRAEGVTVFLVEQNANRALQIADRGYVLETGNLVLEDTGANLLSNDAVRRAYLGH